MNKNANSNVCTEGIRVQAAAWLNAEESDPDRRDFRYGYRITITNEGESPAKLLSRHWVILDSLNDRRDVRGSGVVGQTPRLAPGESFTYDSYCPMPTEWGTMEGSFRMARDDGEEFDVVVGRFFLVPSNPPILQA